MNVEPTTFSAEDYFATQTPPSSLHHDVEQVKNFVARQAKEGRKVVLVTVRPLSNNTHPSTSVDRSIERWYDCTTGAQCVSAFCCCACGLGLTNYRPIFQRPVLRQL